jgi:hypothetical protein
MTDLLIDVVINDLFTEFVQRPEFTHPLEVVSVSAARDEIKVTGFPAVNPTHLFMSVVEFGRPGLAAVVRDVDTETTTLKLCSRLLPFQAPDVGDTITISSAPLAGCAFFQGGGPLVPKGISYYKANLVEEPAAIGRGPATLETTMYGILSVSVRFPTPPAKEVDYEVYRQKHFEFGYLQHQAKEVLREYLPEIMGCRGVFYRRPLRPLSQRIENLWQYVVDIPFEVTYLI